MKAIILVDIPEDGVHDMLSPYETKISLDYADKVLYLNGKIRPIPEKKELYLEQLEEGYSLENMYGFGRNECIEEILGE